MIAGGSFMRWRGSFRGALLLDSFNFLALIERGGPLCLS